MKTFLAFFPLLLGAVVVVQNGLNEKMQDRLGLISALLFNNVVFITISLALLIISLKTQLLPSYFNTKSFTFELWYILPGILGAIFVAGSIVAFQRFGASTTIIFITSGQVLVSLLWDYFVLDKSLGWTKFVGAFFAIAAGISIAAKD